ncbi:hypothetical protein [Dokdonia sp.]|uniref:C1q-like domain-containing protein n=1 Tax=Dokdonia sp. TaxID=2024995 RepID=UPI0032648707
MKKNLLIALALLCYSLSFSQTFNYQAVVRDASGDPVINQSMGVLVRIIAGSPTGSVLYNEAHTVTSNDQGVITLPVGGGTSGANFLAIDWSTQNHWIDIQVDLSGGTSYTQIGTSELRFVPYAMYALNSNQAGNAGVFSVNSTIVSNGNGNNLTDDFVFGASQLDHFSSNSPFNARMFYDKSKRAFRAGFTFGDAWDEDKIGDYSVGFGEGGIASGRNSFSMGRNANATGNEAFAFGLNAGGFADYAKGFGLNARAFGQHATAIGRQLNANSMAEIQLGQYSNFVSGSTDTWVPTDRLFVIGNGQEDINLALNSDALVMLKNGNTTLNGQLTIDGDNQGSGASFTLPAQDGTANQIMSTDGAGNVAWVSPAAAAIPNGGTNGYVLSTDGSGALSWVTNEDTDADPTNEIELPAQTGESGKFLTTNGTIVAWQDVPNEIPTGGTDGQVLSTDGSGVYSWADQTATAGFSTTGNVTSNTNGTIATDDFVFGSTQLDNVSGADDNSRMFFDKSRGAFRAGNDVDGFTGMDEANIGPFSVGFGQRNVASGFYSSTLGGQRNTSSGWYSLTMGDNNTASSNYSVALGRDNTASGINSTTLGGYLTAESVGQISIGYRNTAVAGNANTYVETDRLLVVGNGTADFDGTYPSDALVMLKNGNTTLNGTLTIDGDNQEMEAGYTFPAQDGTANQVMTTDGSGNVSWTAASGGGTTLPAGGTDGQVLATDGSGVYSWVDQTMASSTTFSTTANVTSNANGTIATDDFVFGSSQLANDTNTTDDDRRMYFDKSKAAFRVGRVSGTQYDETNVGDYSAGFGLNTTASGTSSFVAGNNSSATATNSVAIGSNANASSAATVAIGSNANATGLSSIAVGSGVTASGSSSMTWGNNLTAESFSQISLGLYNTSATPLNTNNFQATDRLMVIGNGTGPSFRSDALVVLKNGNTTLNGELTIDGDNTGAGASYTLPAQDGAADQVMTTDGSGNISWAAVAAGTMLPSGGTDGQLLKTDGSGNYAWVTDAVNDADNDPTNEIELPTQTGESGKVLSTNGASPSWVDAPTELPAGGTNGQLLGVSGSGIQWLDASEVIADDSPTNEIELPTQTGESGKILTTDGTTPSWTNTIEATSVKIPSLPAFNVTSNATAYTSAGAKEVGNWNSSVNADLFNDGSHLNITNGRFTAPVDGLYFFSAQTRIDAINGANGSAYSRLMIVKNGNKQGFRNGLHSIRNADAGTANWDTQHVSGILKLEAGDYVSVFVESTGDTVFTLQIESGFNGYLVNKL